MTGMQEEAQCLEWLDQIRALIERDYAPERSPILIRRTAVAIHDIEALRASLQWLFYANGPVWQDLPAPTSPLSDTLDAMSGQVEQAHWVQSSD